MSLSFGTDGVRGAANTELTAEYALAFGRAVARVLRPDRVVVGRDTRISGSMLEAAVCAGLCAEGMDVGLLGVCPTPAVAWACAVRGAAGVMISASHNPYGDNGLKVFSPGGLKLTDAQEAAFTAVLETLLSDGPGPGGVDVGAVGSDPAAIDGYADAVVASLEGRSLAGLSAGAMMPLSIAMVGDTVPLKDRQVALSRLVACGITGQIAGGANLIAFTTGRGSMFGAKPVP